MRKIMMLAVWASLAVAWAIPLWAKPVAVRDVVTAARGWLALTDARPMDKNLGTGLLFMRPGLDEFGQTLFYAVYLEKGGVMVMSPDDSLDPVVAFSSEAADLADPSPCNHLRLLLQRDLSSQLMDVREGLVKDAAVKASKWVLLQAAARDPEGVKAGLGTVADMRVKPLVATRWSQSYVYQGSKKLNCYNYYTPNNYVCGCVATAYAQLMKFYNHPSKAPGTTAFAIGIDGHSNVRSLRGGNGAGGEYDWANMPNDPAVLARSGKLTSAQRMAIGALCYDAGVASSMNYGSSVSGANFNGSPLARTFGFVCDLGGVSDSSSIPRKDIYNFVNPNLDAGMPCALAIRGDVGGHAVIVDGYGYAYGSLYHHLNMGWGGSEDAWYKLPKVSSSPGFSMVNRDIFNVWPVGREGLGVCRNGAHGLFVVRGRVVAFSGNPMPGVKVKAKLNPAGSATCTPSDDVAAVTDANGYYLMKIPAGLHWIIRPQVAGAAFDPDYYDQHGCQWNLDFKRCSRILRFSSAILDFGSMTTGQSNSAPLTLYNDGTAPLTVSGKTVSGVMCDVTPQPPYTIAPGGSQAVTVWLSPVSATSPITVEFASNRTKGTNAVAVIWSAKSPPVNY